jgi:hypothetical protein
VARNARQHDGLAAAWRPLVEAERGQLVMLVHALAHALA